MMIGRDITAVLCAILIMFLTFTPMGEGLRAGFVDDWLAQKTQSSPDYFEGQKRGYFTGGNFSARWKQSNDYLASFDPPRLQFGCGGIDAFMGGFSFLNAEYLVNKLQRILQAAPAMAFDLALSVLCKDCSNIMKSMEEMANSLNKLQLDDCRAGKVLAAKMLANFTDDAKIKAEADKSFGIESGIQELGHKVTELWKSKGNVPDSTQAQQTSGCPADVNAIFNTPGKTVLQALGDVRGLPASHVDLMRGLVGDVKLVSHNRSDGLTDTAAVYMTPCAENSNLSLDTIYRGEVYSKAVNGNCAVISDTNADITNWVNTQIEAVSTKIAGASGLTAAEEGFLKAMGIPIHNALKVAIASNQSPLVMAMISEAAAKTYAFALVRDLVQSARHSVQIAYSVISSQNVRKPNCQIQLFDTTVEAMKLFDQTGTEMTKMFYSDYTKVLNEMVSYDNFAKRFEEFNSIALTKLSVMFKPSVARRAVGQQ